MRASFSLPRTGDFSLPRIDLPLPSPLPRTDPSPPPPRHLPLQNTCLRDRGDPRDGPGAGDASGLGLAAAPDDRVVLGAGTAAPAPRKSDLFCPSTRVSSFWLPLMMMVIVVIVVMMMVLLMTVSVRPLSHEPPRPQWDAEEYGLLGSTEWAEQHNNLLRNRWRPPPTTALSYGSSAERPFGWQTGCR